MMVQMGSYIQLLVRLADRILSLELLLGVRSRNVGLCLRFLNLDSEFTLFMRELHVLLLDGLFLDFLALNIGLEVLLRL